MKYFADIKAPIAQELENHRVISRVVQIRKAKRRKGKRQLGKNEKRKRSQTEGKMGFFCSCC